MLHIAVASQQLKLCVFAILELPVELIAKCFTLWNFGFPLIEHLFIQCIYFAKQIGLILVEIPLLF